jgi:hypothetical protein
MKLRSPLLAVIIVSPRSERGAEAGQNQTGDVTTKKN